MKLYLTKMQLQHMLYDFEYEEADCIEFDIMEEDECADVYTINEYNEKTSFVFTLPLR